MRQQAQTAPCRRIHNRNSPRRQFIVQTILDPASHDLADSTHYDKDKAKPTPPIIAMLPLEEQQDTNTNQEQANGVECCYFVAGDKPDQLLHDGPPLIGSASLAADKIAFVSAAYYATYYRPEIRDADRPRIEGSGGEGCAGGGAQLGKFDYQVAAGLFGQKQEQAVMTRRHTLVQPPLYRQAPSAVHWRRAAKARN